MAHFHDNALIGASGQGGYQIERSLRFNSADSAYLNRTPASAGNQKTFTMSAWVKRSKLGTLQGVFGSNFNYEYLAFTAADKITLRAAYGPATDFVTTQVFRDVSAWYHIVAAVDTTQATSTDRVKLYVNGTQATAFDTTGYPNQNTNTTDWNTNKNTPIGAQYIVTGPANYFDGYLTEVYWIDGQALTPSSFGETDTITGVWKPKRYSGGSYGTNGFYLKFADNSGTTSTTLGKDSSGNGNNWTPNNFSVTAGAGNDSMIDTPTPYADGGNGRGNYCTLNPLDKNSSQVPKDGNLYFDGSVATGGLDVIAGTMRVTSGKWYWESTITNVGSIAVAAVGITKIQCVGRSNGGSLGNVTGECAYRPSGDKQVDGSSSAYGASFTTGDVIGVALDCDAGTVTFYKNNTSQGSISYAVGNGLAPAIGQVQGYGAIQIVNFGQRSFSYTPPAGYKALNTQNLPEPSIKKPSSYMDVKLYTGNGGTQTISGLGFSPDLVWVKRRSNSANSHALFDAVRGAGYRLSSNETTAEINNTANFTAFTSDGFSVASNGGETNLSPETYVAWCWDKSATPGFDIVTYTGDGTTSANRLIDHNLGVKPDFVITKKRSSGTTDYGWSCWHKDLGGNYGIWLDKPNARNISMWAGFSNFSATKFTPPDLLYGNENGQTYVNYLWSEVAGFSKFGSYVGNNSTDGPFVYCGFRPKWVLCKDINRNAMTWIQHDSARSPYNAATNSLSPNTSSAEPYDTASPIDILSNGFKFRGGSSSYNNYLTDTYIFAAFAESPFKYSLAR